MDKLRVIFYNVFIFSLLNIIIFLLKLILREIDEEMTEDELDETITEVSYLFQNVS